MSLFSIPSPVDLVESAINAKLEREVIEGALSAAYSSLITGLWSEGSAKIFAYFGAGQGLRDSATALYLSLLPYQTKGLVLTVPTEMLEANNLSRFQTQYKTK